MFILKKYKLILGVSLNQLNPVFASDEKCIRQTGSDWQGKQTIAWLRILPGTC